MSDHPPAIVTVNVWRERAERAEAELAEAVALLRGALDPNGRPLWSFSARAFLAARDSPETP